VTEPDKSTVYNHKKTRVNYSTFNSIWQNMQKIFFLKNPDDGKSFSLKSGPSRLKKLPVFEAGSTTLAKGFFKLDKLVLLTGLTTSTSTLKNDFLK
jgi:hypothetical protein